MRLGNLGIRLTNPGLPVIVAEEEDDGRTAIILNAQHTDFGGDSSGIYHTGENKHLNLAFPRDFLLSSKLDDHLDGSDVFTTANVDLTIVVPAGNTFTSNTALDFGEFGKSGVAPTPARNTQGCIVIDLQTSSISTASANTMNVTIDNSGTLYAPGGSGGKGGGVKSGVFGGGGGGGQGGHLTPSDTWDNTAADNKGGQGGSPHSSSNAPDADGDPGTAAAPGAGGDWGGSGAGGYTGTSGAYGGSVVQIAAKSGTTEVDGFHINMINRTGGVMIGGGGGGSGGTGADGQVGGANGVYLGEYTSGSYAGLGGRVIQWNVPAAWGGDNVGNQPTNSTNTIINMGATGSVMGYDGTFDP